MLWLISRPGEPEARSIKLTQAPRPGEWVEPESGLGQSLADIGPDAYEMRISTDRYTSLANTLSSNETESGCAFGRLRAVSTSCPRWATGSSTGSSISHLSSSAAKTRNCAASSTPAGTAATCCAAPGPVTRSVGSCVNTTYGPTTWTENCAACCARTWPARSTSTRTHCWRSQSTPSAGSSSSTRIPMPSR